MSQLSRHLLANVCRILLAKVELEGHWCASGPTFSGEELIAKSITKSLPESVSPRAQALLRVVSLLWRDSRLDLAFEDLAHLPSSDTHALSELLVALGAGEPTVREWVSRHQEATLNARRASSARTWSPQEA